MSRSLSNLAKKRAINFSHGLKVVIHQLQHASPDLTRTPRNNSVVRYDPAGLLETIDTRLACLDDDGVHADGLANMSTGEFSSATAVAVHKPLINFLERTLEVVEGNGFQGIVPFMRFYKSFRSELWNLREAYAQHPA